MNRAAKNINVPSSTWSDTSQQWKPSRVPSLTLPRYHEFQRQASESLHLNRRVIKNAQIPSSCLPMIAIQARLSSIWNTECKKNSKITAARTTHDFTNSLASVNKVKLTEKLCTTYGTSVISYLARSSSISIGDCACTMRMGSKVLQYHHIRSAVVDFCSQFFHILA